MHIHVQQSSAILLIIAHTQSTPCHSLLLLPFLPTCFYTNYTFLSTKLSPNAISCSGTISSNISTLSFLHCTSLQFPRISSDTSSPIPVSRFTHSNQNYRHITHSFNSIQVPSSFLSSFLVLQCSYMQSELQGRNYTPSALFLSKP